MFLVVYGGSFYFREVCRETGIFYGNKGIVVLVLRDGSKED
jgi:hypothetical protein